MSIRRIWIWYNKYLGCPVNRWYNYFRFFGVVYSFGTFIYGFVTLDIARVVGGIAIFAITVGGSCLATEEEWERIRSLEQVRSVSDK